MASSDCFGCFLERFLRQHSKQSDNPDHANRTHRALLALLCRFQASPAPLNSMARSVEIGLDLTSTQCVMDGPERPNGPGASSEP
eukprot:9489258-Pyramimonas_sp.AAC.2